MGQFQRGDCLRRGMLEPAFPAPSDGERNGHARRWVRYVMPVMVEVDCEDDEIISVVTLPSEVRLDRDDMMQLCIYDESFRRAGSDEQLAAHACSLPDLSGSIPPSGAAARSTGPLSTTGTTTISRVRLMRTPTVRSARTGMTTRSNEGRRR
jgi:hypothetical protein